jgi:multiple sugar transport system substrate-binding protein
MFKGPSKFALLAIGVIVVLVINIATMSISFAVTSTGQKRQITLTAILEDQGDPTRWNTLILPALQELRARHPDKDIQLN